GRAILAGLDVYQRGEKISLEDSLNELKELAGAANIEVVDIIIQNKDRMESSTYMGKGKIEEIRDQAIRKDADMVIFDDELSGIQIRNLEAIIGVEVIDRTSLILDIFGNRAKSKEGKLQVELAMLKYQKPRLIGLGGDLSRTGAGIGTRGLGETKLELDRRVISKRISDIEKELGEVKKQREVQRKQRKRTSIPTVALVGYTNAGKSTIMNHLMQMGEVEDTRTKSFVKDMLFATLDPFHRKIKLEDNLEFILIDTVGFVSKLPHDLIESFKSTLEEVEEASLLLYVVDISRDDYKLQLKVTRNVVEELNVKDTPFLVVYNKIDKLTSEELEKTGDIFEKSVYISAIEGRGIEELLEEIEKEIFKTNKEVTLLIPFSRGDISSYILDNTRVLEQEYTGDGLLVTTFLKPEDLEKYKQFITVEKKED
ncbi:GTPase HflX, partial [Ilyobacter sp.]|uniref:GTPase HflX n=1 Tax=Ilyobacter sp. TaxID=3100343 RepID=UPI00356AD1CB